MPPRRDWVKAEAPTHDGTRVGAKNEIIAKKGVP